MAMFSLCSAIFLVGMRARHSMWYPYLLEEGIELLILTAPVTLYGNDLSTKFPFNEILKVMKNLKDIRFFLEKVDPCILAKIINETHVVGITPNRSRSRPPYV
jgi:hypothetical protein